MLFVRQLSLILYSYNNNNKYIPPSPPTIPPHLYYIDVPFRPHRPECNAYITLYATCFRKNKNVFEYIIFRVYIFYIILPLYCNARVLFDENVNWFLLLYRTIFIFTFLLYCDLFSKKLNYYLYVIIWITIYNNYYIVMLWITA